MGAEPGHGQDTIVSDETQPAKRTCTQPFQTLLLCNWGRASEKAADGRGVLVD